MTPPPCSTRRRVRLAGVIAVSLAVVLAGCQLVSTAARSTAVITIDTSHTMTAEGPFHGFGLEDDNNWLVSAENEALGSKGLSSLETVAEPRLAALQPSVVRKLVSLSWLFPASPTPTSRAAVYVPSRPDTYRPSDRNALHQVIYTPQGTMMLGLYTELDWLQTHHIKVLLTIARCPGWMASVGPSGSDSFVPNDNHVSIYAADIVAFLKVLRSHGISNVIAVSAPNELGQGIWKVAPGSRPCYALSEHAVPAPTLLSLYEVLEADIRSAGLGSIELFGPDANLCQLLRASGVRSLVSQIGFLDYHEYASATCTQQDAAAAVRAATRLRKQVWVTELGGPIEGSCGMAVGNTWQSLVTKTIEVVDSGVAAVLMWNSSVVSYEDGVAAQLPWGLWGPPSAQAGDAFLLRPTFYLWRAIEVGSRQDNRVFRTSCRGGCGNLLVAALGTDRGRLALVAYNSGPNAVGVTVTLRGGVRVPPTVRLDCSEMDPAIARAVEAHPAVAPATSCRPTALRHGKLSATIPGYTAVVLAS